MIGLPLLAVEVCEGVLCGRGIHAAIIRSKQRTQGRRMIRTFTYTQGNTCDLSGCSRSQGVYTMLKRTGAGVRSHRQLFQPPHVHFWCVGPSLNILTGNQAKNLRIIRTVLIISAGMSALVLVLVLLHACGRFTRQERARQGHGALFLSLLLLSRFLFF